MLKQKIKLLWNLHKEKVLYWIIVLLLIALASKNWGNYFLETIEETTKMPIKTVETSDLFDQSMPWVVKEWKDWVKKVTYMTEEATWNKEIYKTESVVEKETQEEIEWTLKFSDYKVQIQNQISDYLLSLKNWDYQKAMTYYLDFTNHHSTDVTKYNFTTLFKVKWNFLIQDSIPLYNYSTSKALVKTTITWDFYDSVRWKDLTSWDIYSLWNWSEFKILNPEYLSLISSWISDEKMIPWTQTNKSHYLNLEINKFFINFPNHLYFALTAKTTENVLFNKVKVKLENKETWEVIYDDTITYNDISEKAVWKKTIFKWKSGYKTFFWIPIEFKKENFSTIYDNLYENGFFNISKYKLTVKPINDNDPYLNYEDFMFEFK